MHGAALRREAAVVAALLFSSSASSSDNIHSLPPLSMTSRDAARSRARVGPQPRRESRLRLACSRCQRRKIRCDGALPCCNNCRKASAVCTDGDSVRSRGLPRAYVSHLRDRISWLESIVGERCPDVDLSQGPLAAAGHHELAEASFVDDASAVDVAPTQTLPESHEMDPPPHREPAKTPPPPADVSPAPHQPGAAGPLSGNPAAAALSHEIGLVSLAASQDPKYIGPSSGHLLARLMLSASARRTGHVPRPAQPARATQDLPFLRGLMEASHRPVSVSKAQAISLCATYFDVIHTQYPILHHPTFMKLLDHVYDTEAPEPGAAFQVYMVLAIAATILSRRLKISLSAEGYCASAMQYFDCLCIENSIQGLQCLLLLLVYAMHSPSMKLNVWYLNYQCIAALVDLGLQRGVNTNNGISLLEQEMRTRLFWVVFSLDRTIATMMGRPIGLRDEACELRLPQDIDDDDDDLLSPATPRPESSPPSHMRYAIHLFRLAKLNSEIKYVANSIVRGSPRYAYPAIIDIHHWQSGVLQQLDQWASEIPRSESGDSYIEHLCNLRYHGMRMLLLRPSPAIPSPSGESLKQCHHSAIQCINLFNRLYEQDLLVHSWITFHSLILSTITMLYCIWVSPEIARTTELDVLTGDLRVSLSILSATGEHWSGAKRSRDILDELAGTTIRWIMELSANPFAPNSDPRSNGQTDPRHRSAQQCQSSDHMGSRSRSTSARPSGEGSSMPAPFAGSYPPTPLPVISHDAEDRRQNPLLDLCNPTLDGGSIVNQFGLSDPANIDSIMLDLFEDFIPPLSNAF